MRDIRSHLAAVHGVELGPDLIGKVTDAVTTRHNRPPDPVRPTIHIDTLRVRILSGAVSSRPVHLAVGVDTDGRKDLLGQWVDSEDEDATTWTAMLSETSQPRRRRRLNRHPRRPQGPARCSSPRPGPGHHTDVCDQPDPGVSQAGVQAGPPQAGACEAADTPCGRDRPGPVGPSGPARSWSGCAGPDGGFPSSGGGFVRVGVSGGVSGRRVR
ncbi:transposase [Kitasatospora sp. NPDC002965]|uniref:transposase n=1 Tax=Kitasatospora sp. NPDC002965 TaxID=3154775 RepID=UPI0033AEA5B4